MTGPTLRRSFRLSRDRFSGIEKEGSSWLRREDVLNQNEFVDKIKVLNVIMQLDGYPKVSNGLTNHPRTDSCPIHFNGGMHLWDNKR